MDQNLQYVLEKRARRCIRNLEKNRMHGYFLEDESGLPALLTELIQPDSTVAVGGSMTLFEAGVIDFLRTGPFHFLDRYAEGLAPADLQKLHRRVFSADCFLVSTNAITEAGELFNVDGTGNRVAAMIYGPDQVIVIAGINKLVKNMAEAEIRLRETAAPANTRRLNLDTPCRESGYCMDCASPDRICNNYVTIKKQAFDQRMHIVLINKNFGY